MTREMRIEFAGALYHAYSRGNDRLAIFRSDADCVRFLSILEKACTRHRWKIFAYCLMPTHYHLVLETLEPTLSTGMRDLNGIFATWFNRRHDRVGHVFQGRFHAKVVQRELYLLQLLRYVAMNPVRAGLTADPCSFPWSSHACIADSAPKPSCLDTKWLAQIFGTNGHEAVASYAAFVLEGAGDEPDFEDESSVALGDYAFLAWVEEQVAPKSGESEFPREQRFPHRPELPQIFAAADSRKKRDALIVSACHDYGYKQKDICTHLGLSKSAVSLVIGRHQNKNSPK